MSKRIHLAAAVRGDGAVLSFCSMETILDKPRVIDLKRSSWTNRREAVTCPKCNAKLRRLNLDAKPTSGEEQSG